MPRIGGPPGGPQVPPQTGQTREAQEAQRGTFADKVSGASIQGTDAARSQKARETAKHSRISKQAMDIAKRLANGALTPRDATRAFVETVIEERFPSLMKRKKKRRDGDPESDEDKLEEAITDLIEKDPVLAKRLQAQFKKLAIKG
jgi:hypothetical protein